MFIRKGFYKVPVSLRIGPGWCSMAEAADSRASFESDDS